MAKIISSFQMNLSDLSANSASRQLIVSGDRGSKFNIQVSNNSGAFYNFATGSFANGFGSANNLSVVLSGGSYNTTIVFPAASGVTYNVLLFSTPETDTEFSKASGARGKYILNKSITQVADAVLTLAPTNTGSGMKTMPSSTLTASATGTESTDISINWTIENVETDANGFGLRLIRQPVRSDWYFRTTEAISSNPKGDGEDSDTVVVADLTDIVVGMELIYHKGTTVPTNKAGSTVGTTMISSIDTNTNTITFNKDVGFEDSETMTLNAWGANNIFSATGVNLSIGTITAATTALTKTVRTAPSSTTVNLNGTYGIAGGGHVTMKGLKVNNATANTVQSVSASSSAGSMVMSLDQTGITIGTTLKFSGSNRIITLTGTATVNAYPDVARSINLNLDNFITLGAAS